MRLTDEHKSYIVQGLARYAPPSQIQRELAERFGLECSLPRIAYYDATAANGRFLAPFYKELFASERARYLREAPKQVAGCQMRRQKKRRQICALRLRPGGYAAYLRQTVPPGWDAEAWHFRYIASYLDRVETGEIDRLAIHMPPRHGKTECVTVRYATYCLERDPTRSVLITGYNERFARRLSRKARNIAEQRMTLERGKRSTDEWLLTAGGGLMARGVGSPPMGVGFDRIIIDDPIRSMREADSKQFREKLWNWYTDDLYTRLEPGGAIILVMTRYHVDDLAARVVASEPDRWVVLRLPAIAE